MKKVILASIAVACMAGSLASHADTPLPFIINCPNVNLITVDIYHGKASAPGGWTGIGAIPPKHANDWKTYTKQVNYDAGGYCQYFAATSDMLEVVDLQKSDFPSNYNLYQLSYGPTPLSNCWDNAQSSSYDCYFYPNPI